MPAGLTVGDVAARTGVAVSALHFYERKGLIRSERTAGNQRRYSGAVLRKVAIIRVAQELGIPLAEIAEVFAALPGGRTPDRRDWKAMSQRWRADIERRIAALEALRDGLDDCIGCGCLSIDRCVLRNPADRLAAGGAGARLLPSAIRPAGRAAASRRDRPAE